MKSLLSREQKRIDYKSDLFGKLFELSAKKGYDSEKFINQLMTDDSYSDILSFDNGQEWCDEYFLLSKLKHKKDFPISNRQYSKFDLWFMGYLYKYWMQVYNKNPKEVIKYLPIKEFYNNMGFYHTQGWEKVIKEAVKNKRR